MLRMLRNLISRLLRMVIYVLLGAVAALVLALSYYLDSRPDVSVWHLAYLDEEFTTGSDVEDFSAYLALEERLFAQLDEEVYARVPTGAEQALNRYSRGSLSDPARWPVNWNRSFELHAKRPVAGVLLLHGLSDSPYSLRELGERLARNGAWVVGLRVPGHGTAPSGLVHVRWQDMAAAVKLAVRHVRDAVGGDKPLYLVGYSNGGALAVEYTLSALADPSLPRPDRIALLSPEIGLTEFAVLAGWQSRIGHWLGLEKLAWDPIAPEYDPFKYNSFAINAGSLAYQLTNRIQSQISELKGTGKLADMPRILAFQSAVDATVAAPDLVAHLFDRLPPAGHELVLFDLNRRAGIEPLIKTDPRAAFGPLLHRHKLGFDVTIVTNSSDASDQVVARHRPQGSDTLTDQPLPERWPADVYSLAHIALPFAPEDPVYGGPRARSSPGIQLGNIAPRGERGVLEISGGDLLRMHWNPFYPYVERRILAFFDLPRQAP